MRVVLRYRSGEKFLVGGLDSRTWSKCTRTRRCQSLRKSNQIVNHTIPSILNPCRSFPSDHTDRHKAGSLTVLLDLVVVLDRLYIPHTIGQSSFFEIRARISIRGFQLIAQVDSFIVSSKQRRVTHHVDGWGSSRVVVVEGCWSNLPSRQKMKFPFFVWPPADWLTASLSEP
jgi:hypothetical protein